MKNNEHIITKWFRKNGKTRMAVAKEMGIHNSYFTHIEKGRQVPSVCMALKMEAVMGIPAVEILGLATQNNHK